MELPKTYDPQIAEKKWYKIWKEGGYFKPRRKRKGGKKNENENENENGTYSILMPPPNVTGELHAGHALNLSIQDALARYKRMNNFETLYIPGMDHAGIATQAAVERYIYKEEKKTRQDLGREEFLRRVWEWKERYGGIIAGQQKVLGTSSDEDYFLFTMDREANEAVRQAFVDYYNEKLIYQANYIVNWDPVLQSAISDAEVEYREVKGAFYHIFYKIKGSRDDETETIEIATTRPETLLGDTAVSVHPEDERFQHLIGKKAIVPLCDREVPIIGDVHVDRDMGTGCLKVTPGHDFNDFEIGKRHGLKVINILKPDGRLNERGLEFEGLTCQNARPKVVEKLAALEQLGKIKKHIHNVGHGQRSGHPIEPMVSKQWFLKVGGMAKVAVEKVKTDKTRFFSKSWENTYFSWLKEPRDWCISRQLWWGHRIPVFYCRQCHHHKWAQVDQPDECPQCHSKNIYQDPDVLDTWFSSGIWPLSALGWPDKKRMKAKGFDRFFPFSTLITAFDIIFFWVARMMMMSLKSVENIPFERVYIHAIIRDKFGRKMSKSLGNGIDPLEMVKIYGADAFRFTLLAGSGYNRTLNLDTARIDGYRHFINKLWNAFRFIYPFLSEARKDGKNGKDGENEVKVEDIKNKLVHHERWILSELNVLIDRVNKSFNEFRFDEASSAIYSFTYEKFCSWFIELSKKNLYGEDADAKRQRIAVLKFCLKKMLALLHPITPFITEELWGYLKEEGEDLLIVQDYPQFEKNFAIISDSDGRQMNEFIEVVVALRNLRESVRMKPREVIDVCLYSDDSQLLRYYEHNTVNFKTLAKVQKITTYDKGSSIERPKRAVMAITAHTEVFIPLEGVVDFEEQVERLQRNLSKLQSEFEKVQTKLSDENFVKNAPTQVVKKTEERGAICQKKMDSLQKTLQSFK